MPSLNADGRGSRDSFFRARKHELLRLQGVLDGFLAGRRDLAVLDAGCGCPRSMRFGEEPFAVGLDISEEQVRGNPLKRVGIVADLRWPPFRAGSFDVVVCFDVLEHLSSPPAVLRDLIGLLKPGGLLVIGAPNLWCIKGMASKLAPRAVQEWAYRTLLHREGGDHRERFPVVMRTAVAPARVRRFAEECGLSPVHFAMYEAPVQVAFRHRHRSFEAGWRVLRHVMRALTAGRIDNDLTDYIAVFLRPTGARIEGRVNGVEGVAPA